MFKLILCLCFTLPAISQVNKLAAALDELQKDDQFRHAVISMYVADKKGELFSRNSMYGLSPASVQKVITAASAYEMLGRDFRFKTYFLQNEALLEIRSMGDPTLGSNRWSSTKPTNVFNKIKQLSTRKQFSDVFINDMMWGYQPVPEGWVWQDMGNYFGAGAWGLNWRENIYEAFFKTSDKVGQPATLMATIPGRYYPLITSFIKSAAKGSGDNSWLYSAPYSSRIFATGTLPQGEDKFRVAGAMPDPAQCFIDEVLGALPSKKIITGSDLVRMGKPLSDVGTLVDSIVSPSLDSIQYWFLKKSINLFGEAFVKAIAQNAGKEVTTANGIDVIKQYWITKNIDTSPMNITDGSGLSLSNKISTKLLVDILQYARSRNWFDSFYESLPVINNIRMKDGYITGIRSYAGYIKTKNGNDITFSLIVNNITGSPFTAKEKLWKVLDLLKN